MSKKRIDAGGDGSCAGARSRRFKAIASHCKLWQACKLRKRGSCAGARSRRFGAVASHCKHWQECKLRTSGAGLEPARAPSAPAIYGCFHVPRPRCAAGCMYVWVCAGVCVTPDITACYRILPDVTGVAPRKPGRYACARTTRCQNHFSRRPQKPHCFPILHVQYFLDVCSCAFESAWELFLGIVGSVVPQAPGEEDPGAAAPELAAPCEVDPCMDPRALAAPCGVE